MPAATATVETLTAEVRVLMVGSRQVTLSVFNQLDEVDPKKMEPFGRVNPKEPGRWIVGRDPRDGSLVRACLTYETMHGYDRSKYSPEEYEELKREVTGWNEWCEALQKSLPLIVLAGLR